MRLRHDASCKYCLLERHQRFSFLVSAISFTSKNKQDTSLSQERGCVAFKSTTSCSPGDSFGTRETGDRRHVPPRLTRIGGPASIRARLCVRAESKLLQESRCQHTQLEQADRHRSEVENWPHLACPVRRVREAVVRKPAQIGWAANPWTGWCRIAIADDSGAK